MTSRWKTAFNEGREWGYGGGSTADNHYKEETLRAEWFRGHSTGVLERQARQSEANEEQEWRDVILKPLAVNFDATPEVMEELIDVLVDVIKKGKRL